MIFAIVLTYTRPVDEVSKHVDTHKAWLAANVKQGRVIVAGPLTSKAGGLVLANCADQMELDAMMEHDSYIANDVASYHAFAFTPTLASALFPAQWAAEAKVI
jgi:uncharacterized protein YciI